VIELRVVKCNIYLFKKLYQTFQQHLIFDRYRKCSMPDIIYLQEFVGPDCSSVLVQTSIKNK